MPTTDLSDELSVPLPAPGADPLDVIRSELEGLGRPGAGVLAARALAEVLAWLDLSAEDRPAHSWGDAPADLDPLLPVADSLRAIFRTVRARRPHRRDASVVGLACLAIGAFADRTRCPATAVLFHHAAFRANPAPRFALRTGELVRRIGGAPDRAAAWIERAAALAADLRDAHTRGLALCALAALRDEAGDADEALRLYALAATAAGRARRGELRLLLGDARYGAALIHLRRRELREAAAHVRAAADAYGHGHQRVVALAADCAWELMDRYVDPESALRLLNALVGHAHPPARELFLAALRVRTAAALGWEEQYEVDAAAFERTRALAATHAGEAAGLVQAARAAVCFGMFPRAEVAAVDALRIARDRAESRWAAEAAEILTAIRDDNLTDETLSRVFPDAAYEDAPEPTPDAVRLVDALLTALGPGEEVRPAGVAGEMLAGRA